jgi:hypothetical protein
MKKYTRTISGELTEAVLFEDGSYCDQQLTNFFQDTSWYYQDIHTYSPNDCGDTGITCIAIYAPNIEEPLRVYKGNYIYRDSNVFGFSAASKSFFENHYREYVEDEVDSYPTFSANFRFEEMEVNILFQVDDDCDIVKKAWSELVRQNPYFYGYSGKLTSLRYQGYKTSTGYRVSGTNNNNLTATKAPRNETPTSTTDLIWDKVKKPDNSATRVRDSKDPMRR